MKLIVLAPLIALALAGSSAGAYFWLTSEGSVEEAVIAQATPTPAPAATSQETPSTLAAPAEESQLAPPPAQTPAVPADWTTYVDPELGFSFAHPPGLAVTVDFSEPLDKSGAARTRLLALRDVNGFAALGLAIIPNPEAIPLREWIDEFDPCISPDGVNALESASIGGEGGFWCPFNQLNEPNPIFYFERSGIIFSWGPNVSGSMEAGVITPPLLTEADFHRIIDGFTFGP